MQNPKFGENLEYRSLNFAFEYIREQWEFRKRELVDSPIREKTSIARVKNGLKIESTFRLGIKGELFPRGYEPIKLCPLSLSYDAHKTPSLSSCKLDRL